MPCPPPSHAKLLHQGKILQLYTWEQILFDGSRETFECVVRPDTTTVIPFVDEQTVLITKQEQPAKGIFFDFPGGRVDPPESFEQAARRELKEEIGYEAKRLLDWNHRSYVSLARYEEALFLAHDLSQTSEPALEPGEKIELMTISWQELVSLCLKGKLRQPRTMLEVVAMEFDPETKQRLHTWLKG